MNRTIRTTTTKVIRMLITAAILLTLILTAQAWAVFAGAGSDTVFADTGSGAFTAASKGTSQKASLTLLKKNGVYFDFRKAAKQKLYRYDTLQGACADDGIAYLTLYNRKVEKCKIVKVDLRTLKVMKVSKPLPIYHANNLTYNTKKDLLMATCCQVKDKRVVFIDPKKLKVRSKKTIRLTKKVKHLPRSVRKHYKGFTAIAYNEKHNCYIGRLRDNNNVIIFNSRMRPVRYVKLSGKKTYLMNQGMESVGNYIYDVRSFKGRHKYSLVTIHTLSGRYVGRIRFPYGRSPGNELECVFHDGKQFYAGFYYSTSQAHDNKSHHVKRINRLYRLNNHL